MNALQAAALSITLLSFLPLIICLVKFRSLKKFKAGATVTTAAVTASEKRRGIKGAVYYLLDIKYMAPGDIVYTARTISWKKYLPGETIPLMFTTNNPASFKTDFGQSLKWFLSISILLIILVAVFCYWLLNGNYYYSTPQ